MIYFYASGTMINGFVEKRRGAVAALISPQNIASDDRTDHVASSDVP